MKQIVNIYQVENGWLVEYRATKADPTTARGPAANPLDSIMGAAASTVEAIEHHVCRHWHEVVAFVASLDPNAVSTLKGMV